MPPQDFSEQLETAVASILQENGRQEFAEYWDIGKELVKGSPVQSFYARAEGSYVNLVILAGQSIVDIETNENSENPGILAVTMIKAVAKAHFRAGSVQTIPGSEKSQMTLILSIVGGTDAGSYWIAETDAERKQLTHFGYSLMKAVNES